VAGETFISFFRDTGEHGYCLSRFFTGSMKRLLVLLLLTGAVLGAQPASATVVSEGKPTAGGFYWQKVKKTDGSIQYICKSNKESGIQKNAKCNGAKAVKPK
jgi:hypothetical protein